MVGDSGSAVAARSMIPRLARLEGLLTAVVGIYDLRWCGKGWACVRDVLTVRVLLIVARSLVCS